MTFERASAASSIAYHTILALWRTTVKHEGGAHLVEPVLATVTDIDDLEDLGTQTRIEQVALRQLRLEVGATSKYETGHVNLVVRDVVLDSQLGDLADVVVALLVTETSETERGLTTTAVLLGEVDGELVDDLACVACDRAEEGAVTVHDDEAEPGVRLEQLLERFGVEFVVTQIERAEVDIVEMGDCCIYWMRGRTY